MQRTTFVAASAATFGLVLAAFVAMGFGRLVLPYRTARLVAAPALFAAAGLAAVLLAQAALVAAGVREFE